jgi:hypothetical protein
MSSPVLRYPKEIKMPVTYNQTLRSLIVFRGHWLTLLPESMPAAMTTWFVVSIAKAVT